MLYRCRGRATYVIHLAQPPMFTQFPGQLPRNIIGSSFPGRQARTAPTMARQRVSSTMWPEIVWGSLPAYERLSHSPRLVQHRNGDMMVTQKTA
jgi:hypothetical protein